MKKSFKYMKNLCSVIIILSIVGNLSACKSEKIAKEKKLNIFLDISDQYSSNVIKFLIEDFKKNNPDVEIKLNDALGNKSSDIMETINLGTEIDAIFTSRNTLIELTKKGVLSDLESAYEKNFISDRYYDGMSSYGRVGDKFYGIGVVPYSIELLYNKAYLEKLQISNPNNLEGWLNVLKQVSAKGIKTPIALTDDVDAGGFIYSLTANKVINIHDLEHSYDSGEEGYKKLKDMQKTFDSFNTLVKDSGITGDSFEVGNEQSISNFNNGEIPLMACISYYNSKLNGPNMGIIEDYNNNSNYGSNVPIIINSLLCIPINAKNGDTANAFIKYIYSDEVQARIAQSGIISGNKIVNNSVTGIGKIMVQHMNKANDNSILVLYNLPEKIKNGVLLAIRKILDGGYNSKEWDELLKKAYK
ncbi:ABC transporter substrate-binding protein [Clostridium bowmanii]|uniref:ABC transporter substrate-binding protein n=1 Tax=Clostridium bowmanii TaxID=132925 RepID=UPI001C0B8EFE|nr:ABC transporter substrate-binding protein [Clostridium bowmanii]MBU3191583.1 ABC transporter substrate-binding protein [Clostridium bowmanii]MCA1072424.1 ABC transporter substrate-binding protein [Clostridium bowmanii]